MKVRASVKKICDKLNIPATQLFDEQSHFPVMSIPSLKTKTNYRTERRKKDGISNWFVLY